MKFKDIIFSNIYKRPSAFGLDISDFSIKIARLEKKIKGYKLRSFNRMAVPEGIIKGGEIKQEKKLIEIIKKSVAEAKGEEIKTSYAICSIPEQHAFVKIIQLPKMKLKEIREAVKWEAEANIPLSLEEVYLDWQIVRPIEEGFDHFDILINAAPRKLVNRYLQVLQAAEIKPMVFEIESVATARSLIKDGFTPKPVLIIDLGFNRTSFIIFVGRSIRFTSSISVSSQEMIFNLAKKLGVGQEEAQLLKFKIGLDKQKERGKVFNALLPSIVKLVEQVKDCIVFHKEHVQKTKDSQGDICKIILCGGGAYLKGLPEYLAYRLKMPVTLGSPWLNILHPKDKNKIPPIPYKESLAYSTVLGLALRGAEMK